LAFKKEETCCSLSLKNDEVGVFDSIKKADYIEAEEEEEEEEDS
jgi:hypothetical protein